eukprot:5292252-Karenia_brevis.AAC.1
MWCKSSEHDAFSGDVFGDGSKLGYGPWSQCGWAVAMRQNAETVRLCWGPLPVSLPVQRRIKRAEMWAFLKALTEAVLPMTYYTDHLGILTGLRKGRQWCCSSKRPHADVWRDIWFRLEDLDFGIHGESLQVKKVKAHVAKSRQAELSSTELEMVQGNEVADDFAKEGSAMDANFGRTMALESQKERVQASL